MKLTNILDGLIYFFIILCFMGYKIECTCNNQNGTGPKNPQSFCTFPNPKAHSFEYDYMTGLDIRSNYFPSLLQTNFGEANVQAYVYITNNNIYANPYDANNNNQHAAAYLAQYALLNYFFVSSTQGYLAAIDKILNYPEGELGGITIHYPSLKDPSFVFAGNAPQNQRELFQVDCAIHEMGHQLGLIHSDHSSDNSCCIMRSPLIDGCPFSSNTFCTRHKCNLNGVY